MKKIWMILLAMLLTTGLVLTSCDNGTTTKKKTTTPPVEVVVEIDVDVTAASVILAGGINGGLADITAPLIAFNNNDFALFAIDADDVATIEAATKIEIEFDIKSQEGTFRFGLGDPVSYGSNWNYTNLVNDGQALTTDVTELPLNGGRGADVTPAYVLIQGRSANTTLEISAITIYATVASGGTETPFVPQPEPAYFTDAVGLTSGLDTYGNSGNITFSGGIFTVDNPSSSFGISIATPDGVALTDTVNITYALYVLDSGSAGWAIKQDDGWTNPSTGPVYPAFTTGQVNIYGVDMAGFDLSLDTIFLQYNSYYGGSEGLSKIFQLKIIDVAIADGDGGGTGDGGDSDAIVFTDDIFVQKNNTSITIINNGAGYTETRDYGNEYSWSTFAVTLDDDKTLADYVVTFYASATGSDYTYKYLHLLAAENGSFPAGNLTSDSKAELIVDTATSWNFNGSTGNPELITINIDETLGAELSGELEICIWADVGATATFTYSDVTFTLID